MSNAVLEVETKLDSLMKGLNEIKRTSEQVGSSFTNLGKQVGDSLRDQSRRTEDYLNHLGNFGRNVAESIKNEFQALLGVGGILGTFKLGEVLEKSIAASSNLTTVLARMRQSLHLNVQQTDELKSSFVKAFAAARLGAQDAANALEGLQGKGITNLEVLKNIAFTSARIATARGERGAAGKVSGGVVDLLQAQGINPNKNPEAVSSLLDSIVKVSTVTGKKATEVEEAYRRIIDATVAEKKKALTPAGLAQTTLISTVLGPQFSSLIESVNKTPDIFKGVLRDFKGIVKPNGEYDLGRLYQALQTAKRSGLGTTVAAQTYGFDEKTASAIQTAINNYNDLSPLLNQYQSAQVDLNQATYDGMSAMEKLGSIVDVASAQVKEWGDALLGTFDSIRLFGKALGGISGSGTASTAATAGGIGLAAYLAGKFSPNILRLFGIGGGAAAAGEAAFGTSAAFIPGAAGAAAGIGLGGVAAAGGVGLAAYGAANALGADRLGQIIGDAVYRAIHGNPMQVEVKMNESGPGRGFVP